MPDVETPIYLDHHATTPVDERVAEAMQPYFTGVYGNPASDDHGFGAEAKQAVKQARKQLAEIFNTRPEEIIFTSGATESDNLAIRGAMEYAAANDHGEHLITAATEHDAVIEVAEELDEEGFEVTVLPVDEVGRVDPDDVRDAIREDTVLMSIMAANNEIGTIAPLSELGTIAKEEGVLFHTDAVQAVGYLDLDVAELGIDLMSISGHKVYGPKGVGALYVRRRRPKVKLRPLVRGGGHERGYRSGTLNVPGIAGLAEAVQLADVEAERRTDHASALTTHMWERLEDELDDVVLNGPHPETGERLPNNLNVSFLGVENRAIVQNIDDVAVSAGSACTTGKVEASHVLQAITDEEQRWHSAIRFGVGKDNTRAQIDYAVDEIVDVVTRNRRISL
jgi:cysteine desulfurase